MRGVGYYPQLSFADQNALSFRPTCVGAIAQRSFEVRNASRIAVNYAVSLSLSIEYFLYLGKLAET